jgi:undecaprenyl-diphosphatase
MYFSVIIKGYMIHILFEKIKEIDNNLFFFVHQNLKNSFLDILMPIITDYGTWIWPLIIGSIALFIFGGKKGKIACAVLIITILFADNLTSYILKPLFGRIRPSFSINLLNDIIDKSASKPSFSFPSNHATNIFAMAMVLSWYYKYFALIFFTIAGIVGFSRIYVGVHYPFDIVGGALTGISCALLFIWCVHLITCRFTKYTEIKSKKN